MTLRLAALAALLPVLVANADAPVAPHGHAIAATVTTLPSGSALSA